jgi:putative aldouronate transport system permease protein
MIIMRTSFAQVPISLEESARLDGANDVRIMFTIIVPLSKAVIAVIAMYYAVYHWNSWFNAMIYLGSKDKLYPLQLILRQILISNDISLMDASAGSMGASDTIYLDRVLIQYCTIIVATLPILSVYPFLQKYFVKGVMIGSVKG